MIKLDFEKSPITATNTEIAYLLDFFHKINGIIVKSKTSNPTHNGVKQENSTENRKHLKLSNTSEYFHSNIVTYHLYKRFMYICTYVISNSIPYLYVWGEMDKMLFFGGGGVSTYFPFSDLDLSFVILKSKTTQILHIKYNSCKVHENRRDMWFTFCTQW